MERLWCTLCFTLISAFYIMSSPVQTGLLKTKCVWWHVVCLSVHINRLCDSSCVQALHAWVRLHKYCQIVLRDALWPWFFKSGISESNLHFLSWHPSAQSTKFVVALTNKRTGCFLPLKGDQGKDCSTESHQHSYPLKSSNLVLNLLAKARRQPPHWLAC